MARIELRRGAIDELLKSPGVQADLRRRANAVASAAGPGHRVESEVGARRARSAVITDTEEARTSEDGIHKLVRAFGAARG